MKKILLYEEFIDNLPLRPENDLQLLYEYRKEVISRRESEEDFISAEEGKLLEAYGYIYEDHWDLFVYKAERFITRVEKSCFPIFYKDNNNNILLILTDFDDGMVRWIDPDNPDDSCVWIGNIHKDELNPYKTYYDIARNSLVEYDSETQKINIWRYGANKESFQLSKNSKYVDKGGPGELYFREDSEVYRLSYKDDVWAYIPIADGVKEVVITNYYVNSKYDCQPLFLMGDGTLKVYTKIEDVEASSKECLQPIEREGSYKD